MKLRLHGTHTECAATAARLGHTPGLHLTDQSRPSPDRRGELVRVYLTAQLNPATSGGQPGQPAGTRGGSQR